MGCLKKHKVWISVDGRGKAKTTMPKNKKIRKMFSNILRILSVGATGFEPATTRPPAWYATGLRYAPIPL